MRYPEMINYDVAITGGGAAGLFCAAEAGARGKRVVLLEHQEQVGKKIAISGGGRCNFTNLHASPANYLSANPHFCKSALARYTPQDFVALVERHGIPYHEKKLGQLFCDGRARAITDMLLAECAASGNVEIRCGARVTRVEKPERFRLHLENREQGEIEAAALVLATGGLSFPKLGATDFGHRIARQFGLALTPLRPGLVPLTWSTDAERQRFGPLSGVALPVVAHCGRTAFPEALLFTHRGISGPAALQISSFWREGETIELDLLAPPLHADAIETPLKQRRVKSLAAHLSAHWPTRFAETWSAHWNEIAHPQPTPGIPPKPPFQYKDREIAALLAHLRRWPLRFTGTEGYPKAEVTLGGVDTSELSSKTMEARKVPGLYCIGEVVDVTGWLGGYNFQWAWASAHACAEAVSI